MNTESQKGKILVVEDNYSNYLFIKIVLQDLFFVEWAKDGESAIDLFSHENYNLILMDYKMPNISGIEVTQFIRKRNKTIPIIAQTGYDLMEKKLLSAGCNQVLIKPIKRSILLSAVKTYLPEIF